MCSRWSIVRTLLLSLLAPLVFGTQYFTSNVATPIFSGLCPAGCPNGGEYVGGFSVKIVAGYNSIDQLLYGGSVYADEIRVVKRMTVAEAIQKIETVEFKSSDNGSQAREVRYTLGTADYLPATQHFYETKAQSRIPWFEAQEVCSSHTSDFLGLVGYLATTVNKEELDFAVRNTKAKLTWLGFGDLGVEGQHRWVTGPEGCP
eukprot:Sspe_Gene.85642::Locus_56378_Transcript_1_1_Confidence_1.000_Length_659::g.85642::m.85642